MFCPRNSTPWAKELPSPTSHSNRSLRTEVSVAGKRNFQGRDKEAETALEIQGRRCRDKISLGNSANSGLIAGFREISVRTRMRGGPGRTRTANQIVMKWSRRSPSAAWLGAYATAPGDFFGHSADTKTHPSGHQLAPPSQVLDIATLVARPKRFELLTPRFVVWFLPHKGKHIMVARAARPALAV